MNDKRLIAGFYRVGETLVPFFAELGLVPFEISVDVPLLGYPNAAIILFMRRFIILTLSPICQFWFMLIFLPEAKTYSDCRRIHFDIFLEMEL